MKAPSSTLFELIKKMTQEEKQYFSRYIYLEKKDAKNMLLFQMFSAMNEMSEYHEDMLKEKLRGKLKGESFRTYKSILKEKIIQSLSSQGTSHTGQYAYRKKIERAEIVASKGIDKDALETLHTIRDVPLPEFHLTNYVAKADALVSELWIKMNAPGINQEDIASFAERGLTITSNLHQALIVYTLSKKITACVYNCLLMDTKEKKILFEQAVSDFNQYVAAYHDDEPYFVTEARSGRAMIEGDFEQAYTYAHLLWHKYTMMYHYGNYTKETDYVFYGRALHTVITAGILSGRKNNLFSIIGYAFIGYERFPGTNENQYYYPVCMYGYLIACYEKGDATELNIVLKKIEGLPLWNQDHPDMMLYRTLGTWLGIVYHALHEYKASLQWIKTVIASNHKDTTCIHYVEFCKLFEFIVEYELLGKKINTSFKLSVESAYEQLRKHPEKERACTAILLLFFKHLAECKREQKRQDVILKLKKDIAQMKDTFAARYFNSLFDFGNWVEQLTSTVRIKAA